MTEKDCLYPSEDEEAYALADYLRARQFPCHHHANEGGYGNKQAIIRGAKAKRMGQTKGFWDMSVFIPITGITGDIDAYQQIMIELKRTHGGTVSKEQKDWGKVYELAGIPCKVCKGCKEAIDFIRQVEREINGEI